MLKAATYGPALILALAWGVFLVDSAVRHGR